MFQYKIFKTTALASIFCLASLPVVSSELSIKNDNTCDVEVIIEPGEGTLIKSSPQVKQIIHAGKESTINVTKSQMGGSDTYSIIGKVTIPSLYNRCSGLFIGSDYKIVFTESKTGGTICYAEKITHSREKTDKDRNERSTSMAEENKKSSSSTAHANSHDGE